VCPLVKTALIITLKTCSNHTLSAYLRMHRLMKIAIKRILLRCTPRLCSWPFTFRHVGSLLSCTLISSCSLNHYLYADDTQLFLSFHPTDRDSSIDHLHNALNRISFWMTANLLTLNSFVFFFRTDSTDSPGCLPILLSISIFHFLIFLFSTFQLLIPCGRLS